MERNSFILKSGFNSFDHYFDGFYSATVDLFGSVHQIELTSFLLSIVDQIIHSGNDKIAFLSLAESNHKTVNRLLSFDSGISFEKIETGAINEYEMTKVKTVDAALSTKSVLMEQMVFPSISDVTDKINFFSYKGNLRLVIIDEIERIGRNGSTFNPHNYLAIVINEIKKLSFEINIPILCSLSLSQKRMVKNPEVEIARLVAFSNDADRIFFLTNREYFGGFDLGISLNKEYHLTCIKNKGENLHALAFNQDAITRKFTEI